MNWWASFWVGFLSPQPFKQDDVQGTDVSSGHVGSDNVVLLASHPKYIYHQPGETNAFGQARHLQTVR